MTVPVLLLHPLAASASFWNPVIEQLPDDLNAFAVDLPGHGCAPLPSDDPSLDDWGRRVLDAVDERGYAEFVVVGMSLGGLVAAQLAATTDRVRGVVIADAVDIYPDEMRAMWSARARAARQQGTGVFVEPTMNLWFSRSFREANGAVVQRALSELASIRSEGYARATELLATADLRLLLSRITCPALVACGRDDGAAFVDAAPRLASAIPRAELRWLDGQHATVVEHPGAFAENLRVFLTSRVTDRSEVTS